MKRNLKPIFVAAIGLCLWNCQKTTEKDTTESSFNTTERPNDPSVIAAKKAIATDSVSEAALTASQNSLTGKWTSSVCQKYTGNINNVKSMKNVNLQIIGTDQNFSATLTSFYYENANCLGAQIDNDGDDSNTYSIRVKNEVTSNVVLSPGLRNSKVYTIVLKDSAKKLTYAAVIVPPGASKKALYMSSPVDALANVPTRLSMKNILRYDRQ